MDKKKVYEDAFNLMCGERISWGSERTVYENRLDKNSVVKVFHGSGVPRQNILEFDVWQSLGKTDVGKWFAPILWMSHNGMILIQSKTTLINKDEYPSNIPKFFTDLKYSNFGMFEGNFVAHDYGNHLLYEKSCDTKKMKKAKWWSE